MAFIANKWGYKVEAKFDTIYLFRFLDDLVEYYKIEDINEIQKVVEGLQKNWEKSKEQLEEE